MIKCMSCSYIEGLKEQQQSLVARVDLGNLAQARDMTTRETIARVCEHCAKQCDASSTNEDRNNTLDF